MHVNGYTLMELCVASYYMIHIEHRAHTLLFTVQYKFNDAIDVNEYYVLFFLVLADSACVHRGAMSNGEYAIDVMHLMPFITIKIHYRAEVKSQIRLGFIQL